MRRSYLAILLVLLLSAALGMAVAEDPGYLMIAWRNLSLETSIWVALLAVLLLWAAWLLLRALLHMVGVGSQRINPWSQVNRRRRAERLTTRGLLDLAEGRFRPALKSLRRSADHAAHPLVNYLAAARAAHELEDYAGCEQLLRLAHDSTPRSAVAVSLARAQMQVARGQLEPALATLDGVLEKHPQHAGALRMLVQLCQRLQDWPRLQPWLPRLREQRVLAEEEVRAIEQRSALALLQQAGEQGRSCADDQASPLHQVWDSLPKHLQRDAALLEAYCLQLRLLGGEQLIEKLLCQALEHGFSERLVHLYGLVAGADPLHQLARAEQWLQEHPRNAVLLLAAARLAMRQGLWGKAREYLEASFVERRDLQTCAELARLLEHLGDRQALARVQQQGFELLRRDLPALSLPTDD